MGRVVRIIAAGTSLLTAGGAIMASLLALDPDVPPRIDALNHFAPLWLIGGLAALIIALPLGRSRLRSPAVAVALIAVGLNGAKVAPEYVQRLGYQAFYRADDERLKLVQFNAYLYNNNPARAVDWLIAQKADVIVVEEGGGLTKAGQLRLRTAYPHCGGCRADGNWSNMILSRRPILAHGSFDEPGLSGINGGWARFQGRGGEFTVTGAHLAWPWLATAPAQHAGLARFVSALPPDRTIVAGDFNMTPWSHALQRLDGGLGLPRVTHGVSSWPARGYYRKPHLPVLPMPYIAIDQVYAGRGWRASRVRRGPSLGSDHYPIIVELVAR